MAVNFREPKQEVILNSGFPTSSQVKYKVGSVYVGNTCASCSRRTASRQQYERRKRCGASRALCSLPGRLHRAWPLAKRWVCS